MRLPTGVQHEIETEDASVVITEVGATIRRFLVEGGPVLLGFDEGEISSGSKGQVLFPWPNRLRDGTYTWAGTDYVIPIDEVARACAIHGLVRWLPFRLLERDGSTVILETTLFPSPGYPFCLRLTLTYRLIGHSLTVTTNVTNEGEQITPFGIGFHPYLAARGAVDTGSVRVPANSHLVCDERGIPLREEPATDFVRDGLSYLGAEVSPGTATLGATVLDDCFTGLDHGEDHCWRVLFSPTQGASPTVVWAESSFSHVMCFTADTLGPADRRRGIAIEPMTCPPNALSSREGLLLLEPGACFTASFGIEAP